MKNMKKILSKKGVSDLIVILIIVAISGAATFLILNGTGKSWKASNDSTNTKISTEMTNAANDIKYECK